MIVVDASVALKWFVIDEPLVDEAGSVLTEIERDPAPYFVPDLFMNELLAVLCRLPESRPSRVQEALALVESLGMTRASETGTNCWRWRLISLLGGDSRGTTRCTSLSSRCPTAFGSRPTCAPAAASGAAIWFAYSDRRLPVNSPLHAGPRRKRIAHDITVIL